MSHPIERYFVVPHTHWDREWYRPFEHFRLMLGTVVDEVLDVLEYDRTFRSFTLDGQAIVLEDYVELRPQNEARLRSLIAEGRIEIGPSYILPDEFLVGGEALIRNLLIGRAVCERFGGRPSVAGYLPDSFGHPLQLPQILAGFGIESFLFSRGLGDQLDELGVAFNWVAPDGSSVLALQLLAEYGNFARVSDADDGERRVRGLLSRFGQALERADINQVLLCNGTDHVHIQPEMPSVCAELEQRIPGTTFTIAQYGDYVSTLRTGELPSWRGELLGSRLQNVLRGVNSARLYLKQANERAEQALLSVETLASLCSLRSGRPFPLEDFTLAWRELLKCQPHDSICGCSCDEVHRDMLMRWASLDRTVTWLCLNAVSEFDRQGDPGTVGLFNPLPFARSMSVSVDGIGRAVVSLDGFEARTVELQVAAAVEPREASRIESDRFVVELSRDDGTLTIEDHESGRRFDGLHALEDEFDMGDLYNFCPVEGTGVRSLPAARARIVSDGPDIWELEISYEGDQPAGLDEQLRPRAETVAGSVTTIVRLIRGVGRVEFETTIENAAADHRLRVVFPVDESIDTVRAEGQFAVVRRPLHPPEPQSRWCEPPDRTQHAIGAVAVGPVALFTRGLPEYEARAGAGGTELCLTMLRCVGLISRPSEVIATRPHTAGPQTPTPEGQCLGRHVLDYAVRFDADQLDDTAVLRQSQDYRSPFLVLPSGVAFGPPVVLEGDIAFSCLKGAEDGDGLVVRLFNPAPETISVRVVGPVSVARVRLDETGGVEVGAEGVVVGPAEIATIRVRRATGSA